MLGKILIPTITGLVGVLIGTRIRLGWDSALRKQRFRNYLRGLRRTIDTTETGKLVLNGTLSIRDIPKLENEILDVSPYLKGKNVGRIEVACAAYKATRFSEVGEKEKNEHAKAKLVFLLKEISRFAK